MRLPHERGERLVARRRAELVDVDARRDDLDALGVAAHLVEHFADVLGAGEDGVGAGERLGAPAREVGPPAHRVLELGAVRLDAVRHPARGTDGRAEQDVVREDEICRPELAQRRRVRRDVRVPLLRREVAEQPRVEPLVLVEDEDGQQPLRQLRHDDARAAEVEPLGMPLLADDGHVVPGPHPLARDRPGVDVRPGAAEQVPVPEKDPHAAEATSGGGESGKPAGGECQAQARAQRSKSRTGSCTPTPMSSGLRRPSRREPVRRRAASTASRGANAPNIIASEDKHCDRPTQEEKAAQRLSRDDDEQQRCAERQRQASQRAPAQRRRSSRERQHGRRRQPFLPERVRVRPSPEGEHVPEVTNDQLEGRGRSRRIRRCRGSRAPRRAPACGCRAPGRGRSRPPRRRTRSTTSPRCTGCEAWRGPCRVTMRSAAEGEPPRKTPVQRHREIARRARQTREKAMPSRGDRCDSARSRSRRPATTNEEALRESLARSNGSAASNAVSTTSSL